MSGAVAGPALALLFEAPADAPAGGGAFEPGGDVAGLPLLVRTVLGFQAGGGGRVILVGAADEVEPAAALLRAERRVALPVETAAAAPALEEPAVVMSAGVCLHRDLAKRLARAAVSAGRPTRVEELRLEGPEFAVPARTAAERADATHRSVEALRKPIDGLVSRHLNRHVSLFLTRALMRTGIRPNQVSLVTLSLGVAAGVLAATGGWLGVALAGVLLQLQSILDGVDGELARLKYLHSRLGEWLDTLSDDLSVILFLGGVAVGLWRTTGATWGLWLGGTAVAALVAQQVLYYTLLITVYRSGDLLAIPWVANAGRIDVGAARGFAKVVEVLKPLFKHDFNVFLFCLLALAYQRGVILAVGAGGALIALVAALLNARRGRG
ncbi:MAG TPA: CDP-alcohol phosphatidyltransferase family protein [Polyangia bacterium]